MKARAIKQVGESSASLGKSGSFVRTFPVQAKPKGPSPAHQFNDTEQECSGNITGLGTSFDDMPVFTQQRRSNQGQGGSPLPAQLRQKMESAFGSDFSNVRVHQGPSADSLGALAFTQGRDIHFAPGQYNPASAEGQRIIAHELTHVVQQRRAGYRRPIRWERRLMMTQPWRRRRMPWVKEQREGNVFRIRPRAHQPTNYLPVIVELPYRVCLEPCFGAEEGEAGGRQGAQLGTREARVITPLGLVDPGN